MSHTDTCYQNYALSSRPHRNHRRRRCFCSKVGASPAIHRRPIRCAVAVIRRRSITRRPLPSPPLRVPRPSSPLSPAALPPRPARRPRALSPSGLPCRRSPPMGHSCPVLRRPSRSSPHLPHSPCRRPPPAPPAYPLHRSLLSPHDPRAPGLP